MVHWKQWIVILSFPLIIHFTVENPIRIRLLEIEVEGCTAGGRHYAAVQSYQYCFHFSYWWYSKMTYAHAYYKHYNWVAHTVQVTRRTLGNGRPLPEIISRTLGYPVKLINKFSRIVAQVAFCNSSVILLQTLIRRKIFHSEILRIFFGGNFYAHDKEPLGHVPQSRVARDGHI